jgi:hypothetical protein
MRVLAWFAALVLVSCPRLAFAADGDPSNASPPLPTWEVGATPGVAWTKQRGLAEEEGQLLLQLAVGRRFSEHVSAGVVGSYSPTIDSELDRRIWRVSAEGRLHLVPVRFVDLWADGELGVVVSSPSPDYAPGEPPKRDPADPWTHTHAGPVLGAGVGVDLLPIRYFSLGLEARALAPVLGEGDVSSLLTLGLTLMGRLPI